MHNKYVLKSFYFDVEEPVQLSSGQELLFTQSSTSTLNDSIPHLFDNSLGNTSFTSAPPKWNNDFSSATKSNTDFADFTSAFAPIKQTSIETTIEIKPSVSISPAVPSSEKSDKIDVLKKLKQQYQLPSFEAFSSTKESVDCKSFLFFF